MRLMFLGSGAMQHVFEAAGSPRDHVWKIPAIWDDLLPADPVKARVSAFPAAVQNALRGPLRPASAAWLRRGRRRGFRRMLRMLQRLDVAGCGSVVAQNEVTSSDGLIFVVRDAVRQYVGPVLRQRRADCFFEDARYLACFEWQDLVSAQERLWHAGFALADAAGAFGPDGWALQDGRVVLADTSSITDRQSVGLDVVAPYHFERARQRQLRRVGRVRALANSYFEFAESRINQSRLTTCWPPGH